MKSLPLFLLFSQGVLVRNKQMQRWGNDNRLGRVMFSLFNISSKC